MTVIPVMLVSPPDTPPWVWGTAVSISAACWGPAGTYNSSRSHMVPTPSSCCYCSLLLQWETRNIDGLVQDCSISSALAMEILQSCSEASIQLKIQHGNISASMAWCKIAVSPVHWQWRYHSLALSHWYNQSSLKHGNFSPNYSQKTLHSSASWASYRVSFVSSWYYSSLIEPM